MKTTRSGDFDQIHNFVTILCYLKLKYILFYLNNVTFLSQLLTSHFSIVQKLYASFNWNDFPSTLANHFEHHKSKFKAFG